MAERSVTSRDDASCSFSCCVPDALRPMARTLSTAGSSKHSRTTPWPDHARCSEDNDSHDRVAEGHSGVERGVLHDASMTVRVVACAKRAYTRQRCPASTEPCPHEHRKHPRRVRSPRARRSEAPSRSLVPTRTASASSRRNSTRCTDERSPSWVRKTSTTSTSSIASRGRWRSSGASSSTSASSR